MLTQGWSNYLWNSMPIEEQLIDMKHKGHLNEQTATDELGKFTFQGLYFPDTAALFIQGFNKKGKLYTEVFLDSIYKNGPAVSACWLPVSRQMVEFPVGLYQQQFFNQQALRDYSLKTGAILLDEVTVTNKYTPVSDGHFRLYAKPMDSFKITEKDYHYLSVFDYLNAHVSGLRGPTISFTSGASGKLLLLDGVQTEFEILQAIPMSDVDVIEFIKHFDVTNVAMFGTRGAGGIISVFTKLGGEATYDNYVQGTLSDRIKGFSYYREFYSPAYTPENIDSEKPDRRITLYWNPDITTYEGRAKVSFFTSDDFSSYKVIVEGITNTGEVCLGNTEILVASEQTKLIPK